MKNFLLAGDIGGTKTTLAVIDPEIWPREFLDKSTFPSRDYPSLEVIVHKFLNEKAWKITRASFGIAGPVVGGHVQATNLPWYIEENMLRKEINVPVSLVNDLTATAHAVPFLTKDDLFILNSGVPFEFGPISVISPGTGLGEAYLTWDGTQYRAFPSEGGHADFAPADSLQIKLLAYLQKKFGHVSFERVCSGKGLPNIYSFLKEEGIFTEPPWLNEQLAQMVDPSPVITQAALEGTAEIALATLNLFTSVLGAEAGNFALKILSTGGIYLGGGIPPRIIPFLRKDSFLKSIQNKGRFASSMKKIPVNVIQNPETALIGAACLGLEMAKKNGR